MRIYESTFILSPQADDAAFEQQINAVTDLIKRNDGKTIQEDRWGVRRLAFPIQKFTQGFYTRVVFEANNKVLSELERFYKLEEPYIRYLTVLCEGDSHTKIFGDAVQSSDATPVENPIDEKKEPAPATTEAKKEEKVEPVVKETPSTPATEDAKAEEPSAEATNEEPKKTED